MRLSTPSILAAVTVTFITAVYIVEPWTATFVDDGPYYSNEFSGPAEDLPLYSQVELRRFGRQVYVLESRQRSAGDRSVLVLRDTEGSVQWSRTPEKPDGPLGRLELRKAEVTWYGGWRVSISPEHQEGGGLYLGAFGGFRFFNHSW